MQEVSRVHSTKRMPYERNPNCAAPFGKEQTQTSALPPDYVAGFIDGEGSFSVCINKQVTTRSGYEVRPQFSIELRADDHKILERIMVTIGCGKIYDCSYERYGWFPHTKYKISSVKQIAEYLIPFLDKHPLQAKKANTYRLFREVVLMVRRKEHLTQEGFQKIQQLRMEIRKNGKKHKLGAARIRENRSSGGIG